MMIFWRRQLMVVTGTGEGADKFVGQIAMAVQRHVEAGRPNSGDLA